MKFTNGFWLVRDEFQADYRRAGKRTPGFCPL